MQLHRLVESSREVTATSSRTAKTTLVATLLAEAEPHEVGLVASYLAGALPQRRTGIGWRTLAAERPAPAARPTLEVAQVDRRIQELADLAGSGSSGRRRELLRTLYADLTDAEQRYVTGLFSGELRQGASDGVLLAAIAQAADVPAADVRRAVMLAGSAAPVAQAALTDGAAGLARISLEPGRPLRPMLAGSAPDVAAALDGTPVRLDRKLDGIRIQAHKVGEDVRLFTRSLEEVTERLPEVVELVAALPHDAVVLDGEVIALAADGRPEPFQVTGSRTASAGSPATLRASTPLTTFFFDLLHLDGEDLLDLPASQRFSRLADLVSTDALVPSVVTDDTDEAQRFFAETVAAGHEGVVVKRLDAPYAAGRRGAGWVKVKPRHALDLVVLAVERGSGRRRDWLSNIHLGARDPGTGGFVMLGKTFKGMTDETLRWQTERFRELATDDDGWVVTVRPEQVVEIAFDGVQRSSRYPGGVALRFARVLRYRDDKSADEADTLADVRALQG